MHGYERYGTLSIENSSQACLPALPLLIVLSSLVVFLMFHVIHHADVC